MSLKVRVCYEKPDQTRVWRYVNKTPNLRVGYKNSYGWRVVSVSNEYKEFTSEADGIQYTNEIMSRNMKIRKRREIISKILRFFKLQYVRLII